MFLLGLDGGGYEEKERFWGLTTDTRIPGLEGARPGAPGGTFTASRAARFCLVTSRIAGAGAMKAPAARLS